MSGGEADRPLIAVEDVAPGPTPQRRGGPPPQAPLIAVTTLDTAALAQPQPDAPEPAPLPPEEPARGRGGGWLIWSVVAGILGLALAGTVDWVLGLLARMPILGAPAALATAALVAGLTGLAWREVQALRRLRSVEEIRAAWQDADGERLRHLILRVGSELGEAAGARQAAEVVDDAGPVAARRIMSREVLARRDRQAAQAVAAAARQGFVLVTASPSPALDALLLILRAARLLRQIAVLYGYRPGALALRSLALAAGRDAGSVAVADAIAQAAAEAASHSFADLGEAVTKAGAAATATGAGAIVGIPLAAAGLGLSLLGRTVGATGGAVGGGATAAWRLYRFGLMVLVAARPLPFDREELAELKTRMRAELLRFTADRSGTQRAG